MPGAALNAGEEISVNIYNANHLSFRATPVLVCRSTKPPFTEPLPLLTWLPFYDFLIRT